MVNNKFNFGASILQTLPRPFDTKYNETSYAHLYRNTLFITIDSMYNVEVDENEKESTTDEETYLRWFESILNEARELHNRDIIKHIIVQGHLPILKSVQNSTASGIASHGKLENSLWETMRQFKVDLYFCGEGNTDMVTKDPKSSLIQIANNGGLMKSFRTIDLTNRTIEIISYGGLNIHGDEVIGTFLLEKSDSANVTFKTTGELQLLNHLKSSSHISFQPVNTPTNSPQSLIPNHTRPHDNCFMTVSFDYTSQILRII